MAAIEMLNGIKKVEVIPEKCFVTDLYSAREITGDIRNDLYMYEMSTGIAVVHTKDIPVGRLRPHEGSEARYCLDVMVGNDRHLLYSLFGKTSEHKHPAGLGEDHLPLNGLYDLVVGDDTDNKLIFHLGGSIDNQAPIHTVDPGLYHQGFSARNSSVDMMVIMRGAGNFAPENQHIRR